MSAVSTFWLVLGIALWVLEFFTPALVAGSLGTAALLMLLVGPSIPSLFLQLFVFALIASGLILLTRRLVPKASTDLERPDYSAQATITRAIEPGGMGRVAFEGTTWNARCDTSDRPLPAGTKVMVLGRQGNVLDVMPLGALKEAPPGP
ncbi:NfeD family protein [Gloeobacter violaceus]|uniref:Gll2175 protein n=1 Tax=Gloeobacter violaceus (strain ATCC 29082 / PCC 7421) TaxID=251221 RepID=Q7NIK8_GLOVI|nr:NfeD family protein [Gloeobacter violaceus]BAC90116.1 gll2175 [Gloeobacter violaceus PCC 7421]